LPVLWLQAAQQYHEGGGHGPEQGTGIDRAEC